MTARPIPEYEPTAASLAFAASTIQPLTRAVERAIAAGALQGRPREITEALWAGGHGYVSLENSGFLPGDDARFSRYLRTLIHGWVPPAAVGD